jgi:type III secretion protein T
MLDSALIQQVSQAVLSIFLPSVRIFGIMLVFPLFSWTGLQGTVRAMLSLALAFPVAFSVYPQLAPLESIPIQYIFLAGKELCVGLGLGLLLSVPFWAAKSAGDIVDIYRGASQSNLFDPLNAAESTESGTLLLLASLALFVAAGGLILVLNIAYLSFRIWLPMDTLPLANLDSLKLLLFILTSVAQKAVILAAPILICLAVGEIILLFVSLSWKQFNVMDMSMVIKNLVLVLLIPIYLQFFKVFLGDNWNLTYDFIFQLLKLPR